MGHLVLEGDQASQAGPAFHKRLLQLGLLALHATSFLGHRLPLLSSYNSYFPFTEHETPFPRLLEKNACHSHKITEWLRLEGTSAGHLLHSSAQAGPPRAGSSLSAAKACLRMMQWINFMDRAISVPLPLNPSGFFNSSPSSLSVSGYTCAVFP